MSKRNPSPMRRRKHSLIDKLPPEIKETVDEMVKADFTYREIVDYIKTTGHQISLSSVGRYAASLNETIQSLRMAQENFRAIMEETAKYPNLDISEGIIRILSNNLLEAIHNTPEESWGMIDPDTLMKNASALIRAAAYKRNLDIKNQDVMEIGFDQVKGMLFEALAAEKPELYNELVKFLKSKEEQK